MKVWLFPNWLIAISNLVPINYFVRAMSVLVVFSRAAVSTIGLPCCPSHLFCMYSVIVALFSCFEQNKMYVCIWLTVRAHMQQSILGQVPTGELFVYFTLWNNWRVVNESNGTDGGGDTFTVANKMVPLLMDPKTGPGLYKHCSCSSDLQNPLRLCQCAVSYNWTLHSHLWPYYTAIYHLWMIFKLVPSYLVINWLPSL